MSSWAKPFDSLVTAGWPKVKMMARLFGNWPVPTMISWTSVTRPVWHSLVSYIDVILYSSAKCKQLCLIESLNIFSFHSRIWDWCYYSQLWRCRDKGECVHSAWGEKSTFKGIYDGKFFKEKEICVVWTCTASITYNSNGVHGSSSII